jgi:hypothetical protein
MQMKIEIKSWLTGSVLFEGDFSCIADAVSAALKGGANLSGANLSGANLSGANLSHADLCGAKSLISFAQVSFSGHGEGGRMLSAILTSEKDEPRVFCGCFSGTFADLEKYIATCEAKFRKTRTLAMNAVKEMLYARNDSDENTAQKGGAE